MVRLAWHGRSKGTEGLWTIPVLTLCNTYDHCALPKRTTHNSAPNEASECSIERVWRTTPFFAENHVIVCYGANHHESSAFLPATGVAVVVRL